MMADSPGGENPPLLCVPPCDGGISGRLHRSVVANCARGGTLTGTIARVGLTAKGTEELVVVVGYFSPRLRTARPFASVWGDVPHRSTTSRTLHSWRRRRSTDLGSIPGEDPLELGDNEVGSGDERMMACGEFNGARRPGGVEALQLE